MSEEQANKIVSTIDTISALRAAQMVYAFAGEVKESQKHGIEGDEHCQMLRNILMELDTPSLGEVIK